MANEAQRQETISAIISDKAVCEPTGRVLNSGELADAILLSCPLCRTFEACLYPSDCYLQGKSVDTILREIRQKSVQAIGAGISLRNWHMTETAYNELRDKLDELLRQLEAARHD